MNGRVFDGKLADGRGKEILGQEKYHLPVTPANGLYTYTHVAVITRLKGHIIYLRTPRVYFFTFINQRRIYNYC